MNQLRGVGVEHRIFHLLFKTNRILFPCKNLSHLRSQSAQVKVGCREEAHLIVLSKDNQAPASKVCNPIKNKVKYLVSSNLQQIIDFIILLIKRTLPKFHKKHLLQDNLIKIIYSIQFQLMRDYRDKVHKNLLILRKVRRKKLVCKKIKQI